ADVTELRRYGFDVLVDDRKSDPERIKTAIDKGFLLMPRLSAISAKTDPQELLEEVGAYPHKDVVAFWQIGECLGRKREMKCRDEELSRARKVVTAMRQLPAEFSRITTGLVDGDLPLFSRAPGNLDTIGIQPLLWASGQDPRHGPHDRPDQYLGRRRTAVLGCSPGWSRTASPDDLHGAVDRVPGSRVPR